MSSRFRNSASVRPGRPSPAFELELGVPDGDELVRSITERDGVAEMLYACDASPGVPEEIAEGSVLPTLFRVGRNAREFRANLRVVERIAGAAQHTLRLAFISEESDRQELIRLAARGESIPYLRRGAERVPCSMHVEVVMTQGANLKGEATDVSERGLFLAVNPDPFHVDGLVDLRLGDEALRVAGRVVSVVRSGPSRGVGVEFNFASASEVKQIRETVARLRAAP